MNKIIATGILMLVSTVGMATTIHTKIPKDTIISVDSTQEFIDPGTFPQKSYKLIIPQLFNDLYKEDYSIDEINAKNSKLLTPEIRMNLIEYNKPTESYKFEIKLGNNIRLIKLRPTVGRALTKIMPAKIKFNDGKDSIIINNKFIYTNADVPSSVYEKQTDPFVINVSNIKFKHLYLYATRDIPITIEIND